MTCQCRDDHLNNIMESDNLKAFGSAGEIGASCFLLTLNGQKILLDCGIHPKKEGYESLPQVDFSQGKPNTGLITHAHLDHIGALPLLTPQIPFFTTKASKSIAKIMLKNSANIQMKKYLDQPDENCIPLFSEKDARRAVRSLRTFSRSGTLQLRGKVFVNALPAGHILGARSFFIQTPTLSVLYTGDISLTDQITVKAADYGNIQPDIVIIECTLGAEENIAVQRNEQVMNFADQINYLFARRESVLCPTFALGKTQEMLAICDYLINSGKIKPVPIAINGMGAKITRIYRTYLKNRMPYYNPIEVSDLSYSTLNQLLESGPMIMLFTSGMLIEDTPSARVAEQILPSTKHGIFFVGYLDPETPGYKVLHNPMGSKIQLLKNKIPTEKLNPNIKSFRFTSHSDKTHLVNLVESLNPSKVILIHGEKAALENVKNLISNQVETIIPKRGDQISL